MTRRWVYRDDGKGGVDVLEVGADYSSAPVSTGDLAKFSYDGLRQMDGTVTDTPKKLREWVSRNGLAHMDDFKQHRERLAAEKRLAPERESRARKEDIGRAIYQLQQKRGRK